MEFSRTRNIFIALITLAIFTTGAYLAFQKGETSVFDQSSLSSVQKDILAATTSANQLIIPPPQKLSNPPEIVKAVYVTGYSAGTKSYLNYLAFAL